MAKVYVLVVALLALSDLYETLSGRAQPRDPIWFTVINVGACCIMLLMFTGYWVSGVVRSIGLFAPGLLLFALIWDVSTARHVIERGVQQVARDASPELRALVRRLTIGVVIFIIVVGYWFGGIAVLRAI